MPVSPLLRNTYKDSTQLGAMFVRHINTNHGASLNNLYLSISQRRFMTLYLDSYSTLFYFFFTLLYSLLICIDQSTLRTRLDI